MECNARDWNGHQFLRGANNGVNSQPKPGRWPCELVLYNAAVYWCPKLRNLLKWLNDKADTITQIIIYNGDRIKAVAQTNTMQTSKTINIHEDTTQWITNIYIEHSLYPRGFINDASGVTHPLLEILQPQRGGGGGGLG